MAGGFRTGEKHPKAKLSEGDIRAIRASTDSDAVLAKRYGVSTPTIWRIKTRKIWKHLP